MPKESLGTVVKRRTYGVLFLILVAALIGLSIAIYAKAFTSYVDVKVQMGYTGNQLQEASDVKVDGLIVGEVDSVTSHGQYAILDLHLDPDKTSQIAADSQVTILPKTLFGEQYVNLARPSTDTGPIVPIKDGATLKQDTSPGALEAQKVLGNLLPLLTAVQPADLNATLNALATALNGRGNTLGQTIQNLDSYLQQLNSTSASGQTYTAQLVSDLDSLGKVALEYNGVAPDLFASLKNLLVSAHTVITKQKALDNLLTTGSGAAGVLNRFLLDNEQRIIVISGQTQKIYALLAEYSPEYSCLFSGISKLYDLAGNAIYNGAIHLSANPDLANLGAYKPGQQPKIVTGYGPNCFGLPDNPQPVDAKGRFQIPAKYQCLNDGAPLTKAGESPNCKASSSSAKGSPIDDSPVNTPANDSMVNALIAGQLHTTPDKVPSSATLIAGPLYSGQNVVIK